MGRYGGREDAKQAFVYLGGGRGPPGGGGPPGRPGGGRGAPGGGGPPGRLGGVAAGRAGGVPAPVGGAEAAGGGGPAGRVGGAPAASRECVSYVCVRQLCARVRKYLVVQAVQLCCLRESVAWQQWALAAWEPMAPLVAPLSARAESHHCRRLGSSWVCCGTEEALGARCRRGTTNETLHTCSTR
mgnify:CR=1 FL=1